MSHANIPQALLVLPRLRVQNANAISSPLTHGFPSVTAFTGLMWTFAADSLVTGFRHFVDTQQWARATQA